MENPKASCRKAPMSTVPAQVLMEVGVAMLEGALKYGRHNYRDVQVHSSTYYDATMRHLMAWWEGENDDPDSGLCHITKAIASLVVLRDCIGTGLLIDDRPSPLAPGWVADLNDGAAEMIQYYEDLAKQHDQAR